jgi:hypothetical protein
MKKTILLISTITLTLGTLAQAGSWGFTLGDGSGFHYNNNQRQCAPFTLRLSMRLRLPCITSGQ